VQARDPIPQLRKYMLDNGILSEADIVAIEKSVVEEVEESVRFADESPKPDRGQLLENVFADPKGFGIAPDGRYRYELPGFSAGTAEVS
jgi:pyruvate dehydrogenase E1 component alpha subunit